MLFFGGSFGLLFVALWIFCIIDVLTVPEKQCRNLPKLAWVFIVILLSDLGSILWLVGGRPWHRVPANLPDQRSHGGDGLSQQQAARPRPTNPDDDEEFLAQLRARAEEQRRRAREAKPPEPELPDEP